jgi:carbamoyltransferase
MGLSLRHDHNIAVFCKEGSQVELICHLEIERLSGRKHHNVAFYDKEEAALYLNRLLKPYNLTLDNFEGIYGTPGFGSDDDDLSYTSILDGEQIA